MIVFQNRPYRDFDVEHHETITVEGFLTVGGSTYSTLSIERICKDLPRSVMFKTLCIKCK